MIGNLKNSEPEPSDDVQSMLLNMVMDPALSDPMRKLREKHKVPENLTHIEGLLWLGAVYVRSQKPKGKPGPKGFRPGKQDDSDRQIIDAVRAVSMSRGAKFERVLTLAIDIAERRGLIDVNETPESTRKRLIRKNRKIELEHRESLKNTLKKALTGQN